MASAMHTLPVTQRPSTASFRAPRAWRSSVRKSVVVKATVAKEAPAAANSADNSFMTELRTYAMKLHTRDQAKEGGQEAAKRPFQEWVPSRAGFLRFMVESKEVYEEFERIMQEAPVSYYKKFDNTGLERTAALEKDIEYIKTTWGMAPPKAGHDGPGRTYARFLRELSVSNPPAFLCHYYNHYFAHTAGGRMIGQKVSQVALGGWMGDFYKWEGDVKELLNGPRASLEACAAEWSRAEKDACLEETPATFKWAGSLVRIIGEEGAAQPPATGLGGWWRRTMRMD